MAALYSPIGWPPRAAGPLRRSHSSWSTISHTTSVVIEPSAATASRHGVRASASCQTVSWVSPKALVARAAARELEAELGQPLVIRLRNKGLTAHTFTQYDTGTDVVLARGERRTVTIRPPAQATSWRFVCRFHDAGGMHGGLTFGRVGPERLAHPRTRHARR